MRTAEFSFVRKFVLICALALPLLSFPLRSASAAMSWSCAELNTRWPAYHRDLHIAWPLAAFACPSNMSKVVEAIALIHDIKTLPDTGMPNLNFYDWLSRTVPRIDYANEDLGGALTHYHGTGVITLMNPFFIAPLTQRAAMLIHEGRHSMYPADPGHVTCEQGDRDGKTGECDTEFSRDGGQGGGYSWGWVFMWHLMEDPNAVPEEATQILSLLKWELNNRFNSVSDEDKAFFRARWSWDGR